MNFIQGLLVLVVANLAAAWSPDNSYVPANVTCPSGITLVREAKSLSDNETSWLKKRGPIAKEGLQQFVSRATKNFSGADSLVRKIFGNSSDVPVVGIGASGGGYRAMLAGAGMISAFDNRTRGANDHGLGGLLQGTTYLAGLSGGNWLTGTLAWNNWTSVQTIVDNTTQHDGDDNKVIWSISDSIFDAQGNIFSDASHWDHIDDAVEAKHKYFNASITDIWGRALSYDFFPSLYRGGVGYTWSTLRDADVFKNAKMPFPISVADGRYPGTSVVNLNATVFEFNPFEMGSWDPSLRAFADVKYLGTEVSNNKPKDGNKCIAGYDNVGFILGTSSTLFNQFLLRLNDTHISKVIRKIAHHFLEELSHKYDDVAIYAPNPFHNSNFLDKNYTKGLVNSDTLFLVDGGEDQENIPIVPLLQRERKVDVIFALDNSADTEEHFPGGANWPLGSSLVNTYERQFAKIGKNHIAFPYVPDVQAFYSEGLTQRPTFFGCDANNLTDLAYTPPLVVYVPNSRHSFNSNTSTFELSYSKDKRLKMIQNGFEAATMGNLTQDSNFAGCVACAVMRRSQERINAPWPEDCKKCFKQYCWDGKIRHNGTQVTATNEYAHSASFSDDSSSNGAASVFSSGGLISFFAVIASVAGLF